MNPSPTATDATITETITETIAETHARVGLIGNPSDGYGGAAIAFAFDAFAAKLWLEPTPTRSAAPGLTIDWQAERIFAADSLDAALAPPASQAQHGAARLVLAAGRILAATGLAADSSSVPLAIAGQTSIPFQAGLSGSSAIVISALRLFAQHSGVSLKDEELASLALRAETEELGIAAGPMDRIAQVRGGLLLMDFGGGGAAELPRVEAIDATLPEGLYLAWAHEAGAASGRVHGPLRQRFLAGEPRVLAAMEHFRALAYEGRDALLRSDSATLARLFDENFDLRRAVVGVAARDEALVAVGRALGAGVKLSGSGGAVVGVAPPGALPALQSAYQDAGFGWLRPRLLRSFASASR